MMLSRLLLLIPALIAALGSPDLDNFAAKVNGQRVSIEYSYEVKGGLPITGKGKLEMQEQSYYLDSQGLRVWSNGKIRWTADDPAKEVYVENVSENDLMSNPVLLIKVLATSPAIGKPAPATFKGAKVTAYKVEDGSQVAGNLVSAVLYFKGDVPAGLEINASDGTTTVIAVKSFSCHPDLSPKSAFERSADMFKGYQLTDLRID